MQSLWQQTAQLPCFPALQNDVKTHTLIIGGGMAGILCAYMLQQAQVPYVLAEAHRIGSGVTGRTTAKLTSQHGWIYHRLVRRFGLESARRYLAANQEALQRYRALCQTIDCDFEEKPSVVYTLAHPQKLEREWTALQQMGFPAVFARDLPLPILTCGGIQFPGQAQFHPLKFLGALVRNLNLYEHTPVVELSPDGARTPFGSIRADHIIVATHFPILNKHGGYFLKMYQHRSYVIAAEHAAQVEGMYVDEQEGGLSFRNYGPYLLIGGGGHLTGSRGKGWHPLLQLAKAYYPHSKVVERWATQDCMSLDGLPYIGRYGKKTPSLYVATGFNKWGMTGSMVAAGVLTDLVQGRSNPYEALFAPDRTVLRPQLLVNGFRAAAHLLKPTVPRCSHMGCALRYNPWEHSWDCPCHGSRFDENGQCLDNPATGNLKHKP